MKISQFIQKNFAEILLGFLILYLFTSFIPPVAYKAGYPGLAEGIHNVYHYLCHQRVERSPFLFAEGSLLEFYSIEELQAVGAVPESNPYVPAAFAETIFGHRYNGNEEVGYKTALCIRDVAMYIGMISAGVLYLVKCYVTGKVEKIKWKFWLLCMAPMVLDVFFQILGQIIEIPFVDDVYVNSIGKRIVTGFIFGIGFGYLIFFNLKDSTKQGYNETNENL